MLDSHAPSTTTPIVTGIGYQGLGPDALIGRLRAKDITVVIDVRLTPISRKPGLSKTALRQALAQAGIDYIHRRELGNPKDNRAGFASPGPDHDKAVATFRRLLDQPRPQGALEEIRALAHTERIALLCFEADTSNCHRQVILNVLDQG